MGWASGAWATGAWRGTAWAAADALVEVPDVVGETQAAGTATLEGAGFVVSVTEEYSSTVLAGLIISQSPIGGTSTFAGSVVAITVSLGERSDGAGSKKRRRRYYVEIDGKAFDVKDREEAEQLLAQARAMAERSVEIAAQKTERRVQRAVKKGKDVGPIRIERPTVQASPELQLDLSSFKAEIDRLYANAAALIEMRILLARKMAEEEEEDLLLLLM